MRRHPCHLPLILLSAITFLSLLIGCHPMNEQTRPAPQTKPSQAEDTPLKSAVILETLDNFQGVWLRSETAEVFVAAKPYPRILAFRKLGEASPMTLHSAPNAGVRSWFLEPRQNPLSPLPAECPAEIIHATPGQATLLAKPSSKAGLQLRVTVTLDDKRPAMTIRHEMKNLTDKPREISIWSITAFAKTGGVYIPLGSSKPLFRRFILFFWSKWPDPTVTIAKNTFRLDFNASRKGPTKIGIATEDGWGAYVWSGGKKALIVETAYDTQATYPEGGGNITTFITQNDKTPSQTWGEFETVGPIQPVAPGGWTELVERFELLDLPNAPKLDQPDEVRAALESARKSAP